MPYLKPKSKPFERMGRLLKGYDLKAPRLAAVLGCSENTARSRLDDPGSLTGHEWEKIQRLGHIPAEEIRECFLR